MYYGMGTNIGFALVIGAFILASIAQLGVKSTFKKYFQVKSDTGMTGYDVARKILDDNGLYDVQIEKTRGFLSDHYDPRSRVLRLSDEVYDNSTVSSIGVAAHEVGHAIQHSVGYVPMKLRGAIAPAVSFGSKFIFFILIGGIFFGMTGLLNLGIVIYAGIVVFQLITLPVEFDASRRAIDSLKSGILYSESEVVGARKVLSAAAMTYVTATLMSIAELIRLIGLRNRN